MPTATIEAPPEVETKTAPVVAAAPAVSTAASPAVVVAPAADPAAPVATWSAPPALDKDGKPVVSAADPAKPAEAAKPEALKLKLPDGSAMDAAALERYQAEASALGLTEKQAQALLDRDHQQSVASQKAQVEALKAQDKIWLSDLQKDPAFGGPKFAENAEMAKRAFDFADPDGSFRKDLELSGLSNYPRLVKFAAAFGRTMREDNLHAPTGAVPKKALSPMEALKAEYAKASQ